ncbi:MAG: FAD-dependent oxidoreductase, partial [Chloroflexota bacterium]
HNDKCHNMLGKHVVVTLPPHLAQSAINYEPPLPTAVSQTMAQTQTWMGQAMKVSLVYKTPFWRQRGLSGLAVSYRGPVQQFHDASPDDDSCGALFGWLGDGGAGRELPFETRKAEIIEQVTRIFGPEGAKPLHYAELNWDKEPHTTETSYQLENPQEHPQYGHPLLQEAQLNGRLHFAVTEASPVNGGYLDGAVYIAKQVANRIISKG